MRTPSPKAGRRRPSTDNSDSTLRADERAVEGARTGKQVKPKKRSVASEPPKRRKRNSGNAKARSTRSAPPEHSHEDATTALPTCDEHAAREFRKMMRASRLRLVDIRMPESTAMVPKPITPVASAEGQGGLSVHRLLAAPRPMVTLYRPGVQATEDVRWVERWLLRAQMPEALLRRLLIELGCPDIGNGIHLNWEARVRKDAVSEAHGLADMAIVALRRLPGEVPGEPHTPRARVVAALRWWANRGARLIRV